MSVKPIQVEVFSSPGCDRCSQVFAMLESVAQDIGAECIEWRIVNVVEELDYAVELGVLSMPAIAIDGELVFTTHPSVRKLRHTLDERLRARVE